MPTILIEPLLSPVLGIVALSSIIRLLVLRNETTACKCLAGLESLRGWLETGGARSEASLTLLLLLLLASQVHLLLRLARKIFILRSRVIFPGVEVRHAAVLDAGLLCLQERMAGLCGFAPELYVPFLCRWRE